MPALTFYSLPFLRSILQIAHQLQPAVDLVKRGIKFATVTLAATLGAIPKPPRMPKLPKLKIGGGAVGQVVEKVRRGVRFLD